ENYVLGGKEKLDERLARAREGKKNKSNASMATFEASRPTVGSQALGIARAAYEYSLEYAKEREQFGKKIIENQSIAFTLARMKMEIDAARLLVWRASWMGRNQVPFENAEGSMSKLKSGEVAVRARDAGGDRRDEEVPAPAGVTGLIDRSTRVAHAAHRDVWRSRRYLVMAPSGERVEKACSHQSLSLRTPQMPKGFGVGRIFP